MDEREKQVNSVPYIVLEGEQARAERHIKRLWIAFIVTVILMFASNVAWLAFVFQYDFENTSMTTDGNSSASYIGGDGEINNGGTDKSSENDKIEWQK